MNRRPSSFHRKRSKRPTDGPSMALPSSLPLDADGGADLPRVVLEKATSHPNIFRKRIKDLHGSPRIGQWVSVWHRDNEQGNEQLFAYGVYNPKSEIAVRLARWATEQPDATYWGEILDRAVGLRRDTMALDRVTNCYRVIHAEADGVPGVVVDRYANCLSAEVFSIAMAPRTHEIVQRLAERLGTEHWLIQPGPHLQSQEGWDWSSSSSNALPDGVRVNEHDVQFEVQFSRGHKTGFFCDQRDNRRRLADFCRDRSVLDLCCYTGGFSVSAAKMGGAREVIGVDLDAAPLETARRNAAINQVKVKFTQADAFAYMRDMLRGGRQFDVVVLDPPKLIRNRRELDEGTRKHFDMNRLAMQLVKPGGMMLTCSCAGLLQTHEFTKLVRAAARSAFLPTDFNPTAQPRQMQILAHSGAAVCHPVSANCPETEYLKAMWLRL